MLSNKDGTSVPASLNETSVHSVCASSPPPSGLSGVPVKRSAGSRVEIFIGKGPQAARARIHAVMNREANRFVKRAIFELLITIGSIQLSLKGLLPEGICSSDIVDAAGQEIFP